VLLQINAVSHNKDGTIPLRFQKNLFTAVLTAANQLVRRLLYIGIVGIKPVRRDALTVIFPVVVISPVAHHISAVIFRSCPAKDNVIRLQHLAAVVHQSRYKSLISVLLGKDSINAVGNLFSQKAAVLPCLSRPHLFKFMVQPLVKGDLGFLDLLKILIQDMALHLSKTGKDTVSPVV